jgi:hypothetical protein
MFAECDSKIILKNLKNVAGLENDAVDLILQELFQKKEDSDE